VLYVKEQVEWHAVFLENAQAAQDIGPDDEIIVRFTLRKVADADELAMFFQFEHVGFARRAGQVNPPHHAGDEGIMLCQAESPASLCNIVQYLHEDGLLDAERIKMRLQIRRHKVAPDGRMLRGVQPGIVER